MPRAYFPRCDTAYHATTITDNGPVCDDCMTHDDVVVLLPSTSRFSRAAVNASDRGDNARSMGTSTDCA